MGTGRANTVDKALNYGIARYLITTESCCICFQKPAFAKTRVTYCKHVFCEACIMEWLMEHSSLCPMCRRHLYIGPPFGARISVHRWDQEIEYTIDAVQQCQKFRRDLFNTVTIAVPDVPRSKINDIFRKAALSIMVHEAIVDENVTIRRDIAVPHTIVMAALLGEIGNLLRPLHKSQWWTLVNTVTAVLMPELDGTCSGRLSLLARLKELVNVRLKDGPYIKHATPAWPFPMGLWQDMRPPYPRLPWPCLTAWMYENLLQYAVSEAPSTIRTDKKAGLGPHWLWPSDSLPSAGTNAWFTFGSHEQIYLFL